MRFRYVTHLHASLSRVSHITRQDTLHFTPMKPLVTAASPAPASSPSLTPDAPRQPSRLSRQISCTLLQHTQKRAAEATLFIALGGVYGTVKMTVP